MKTAAEITEPGFYWARDVGTYRAEGDDPWEVVRVFFFCDVWTVMFAGDDGDTHMKCLPAAARFVGPLEPPA